MYVCICMYVYIYIYIYIYGLIRGEMSTSLAATLLVETLRRDETINATFSAALRLGYLYIERDRPVYSSIYRYIDSHMYI